MKRKIRVGVLFGGRSGEHEVSLASSASVIRALDPHRYDVIPIGISKQGTWLTDKQAWRLLQSGNRNRHVTQSIITPDATQRGLIRMTNRVAERSVPRFKQLDVVFPVLHGTYGEDGTIQGLLELANIPYVGAGVLGSAVGMDKIIQKQLFCQTGLPVVPFLGFTHSQYSRQKKLLLQKIRRFGLPVFAKPANLGSSVGITKVNSWAELMPAITAAFGYDRRIIVEKAVIKPREIEVAVLGNDHPRASVPGEIIASNDFYDYDAKYVDGQSHSVIPAELSSKTTHSIRSMAIAAFSVLDCAGMARVDFLIGKGNTIYLSEVNTIPGFTTISMYPKLWAATGIPYTKLLDKLIQLAIERHYQKNKLSTTYSPKKKWY